MRALDRLLVRPFLLAQALTPHLKQRGSGKLIFITSCRTALPQLGGAIPDMARAGANALVRSLSIELAPFGIPVNAIAPNYLYSEAYFPKASLRGDGRGSRLHSRLRCRAAAWARPDELAELITYLATDEGQLPYGDDHSLLWRVAEWQPPRPF
jgi:NAD(P)-dependent dehydrogenase (short-subunit alcohol dehydrogenase family)